MPLTAPSAAKRGLTSAPAAPASKAPLSCRTTNARSRAEPAAPDPAEPKPPSKKQIKAAARRDEMQVVRDRLLPLLQEVFPAAFTLPPVPLTIGIHQQILDVAGGTIDPRELGMFLHYWTSRKSYRQAIWHAKPRVNLDGSEADTPSIAHRNIAGKSLFGPQYQGLPDPDEPAAARRSKSGESWSSE